MKIWCVRGRMWCWTFIGSISRRGVRTLLRRIALAGAPIVLAEYGLAADTHILNRRAAELARQAADEFSTAEKPRFVAGSVGPTTKAITVTGGVTFDGLIEAYYAQAMGLVEGGVDLLLVETCQDTRNIKAGVACDSATVERDRCGAGDCVGDDRAVWERCWQGRQSRR